MKKGDKIRFNGHQGSGSFAYEATTVGKIYEIIEMSKNPLYEGRAYYKGDDGNMYVWKRDREDIRNDFTLVQGTESLYKTGDKIRFKGLEEEYSQTIYNAIYTVGKVTDVFLKYHAADGRQFTWYYVRYPGDFELAWRDEDEPADSLESTVAEGTILQFLISPDNFGNRYRDLTVGEYYEVVDIIYYDDHKIRKLYVKDDVGENSVWYPYMDDRINHFKVVGHKDEQGTKGDKLYKDDELETQVTIEDLYTQMFTASITDDYEWAAQLHEQIQQLEGEKA